ncbi:MAG TPA: serine/threonine-protein kinase [Nannocystaceae bacterium]|nr:serine/threonine-protein kinase [Nannocystaceae bacterium]
MDDEHTIGEDDPGASHPAPRRIGRYAVIERIGEGAMGVVYAAFDPELSRKLAIKVLHRTQEPEAARQRLVREAQALARLSHPNVVQIYDVGTHDNSVWVAMELAEGGTLRQWLATPRSWREALSALQQAGRGLAAAHKSGIVHRDFKPDNVLVGTTSDGSFIVRVVDFGLARAAMDASGDDAIRSAPVIPTGVLREDESASDSLGERFTRTGARLGTPAYMAPEQWNAAPIDARTDQFAFCVVAWEALYGKRPFQAENMAMLGFAITQGRITSPPDDAKVPSWIHRLLVKGLQADPADRHADMDVLLDELARDPAAQRRRIAFAVAGAAAIGASVWIGTSLAGDRASDPCAAQSEALAGVWDDEHRKTIDAALRSTGRSYAGDTATNVDARLSSWADRFVAARRDACAATLVRGEQSSEAMDLRIACLDRGRLALTALVGVLEAADVATLDRAVRASEELPEPDACSDLERLRDAALRPEDEAARAEVDAVRERLAHARALDTAARYDAAAAEVDELAPRVDAIAWPPLSAELHELRGHVAMGRGDFVRSESELRTALLAAIAGRHDRLAWSSATWLAQALAQLPGRAEEARRTIALARAQWSHAQLGDREEAALENGAFRVEAAAGDYAAARAHIERTIELRLQISTGEDAELAGAYANLGAIYGVMGESEKAAEQLRRAIAIRERVQAPTHPDVGRDLHNLGSMLAQNHEYEAAAPILARALAIKREVLGDAHPDVAYTLISMGNIAVAQARFADAEKVLREALAIQERALGSDHPDLAFTLLGLGDRFLQDKRPQEALPLFARALAIREAAQGADHPEVAPVLLALGVAELEAGETKAAIAHLERARPALVELGDANELKRVDDALARARAE